MKKNLLLVENQETGKTTYLFNEIKKLIIDGYRVIVLDSATEHEDKSLLKKVINKYNNSVIIEMHDESQVVLGNIALNNFVNNFMDYFPFNEVIKNKNKIICFDLSYFLEKGHEVYEKTNDMKQYRYYRDLYNNLSHQIALSLILMEKCSIINNSIVVMDEIEFPITDYNISDLQNHLYFLASAHPENAFGTFYESFDKIKFKKYQRRKD